ncbi:DNA repair protein rad2 [Coemansia sp. RSA 552]|nr:DNA repair protein rad2 [Coemansia sp. RSA 552]
MGVKGLWTLLEPAARPVRLEALTHARLAVDASIWLYQLVKAMRDAEGNPVEGAHVLGFYRRLCKLLYYGIRPVFVFDGSAPDLKRQTIAERQALRGSRTNDAKRAAHQLLQAQLKLHALDGVAGPASATAAAAGETPHAAPDAQAPSPSKKRKRDEYELPPLQAQALATRDENERSLRMAHPDDLQQLLALATRESGNIDGLDIDTDSPQFKALFPEDQHDLIVALKVRSRQTSHDRLQQMLASSNNAMDFSKQQIDLLVKRNTLTQQWLEVTGNAHRTTGPSGETVTTGRVVGERGREYTLVRSNQPGAGWTLQIGGSTADAEADGSEPAAMVASSDAESLLASDGPENSPPAVQVHGLGTNGLLRDTPISGNHASWTERTVVAAPGVASIGGYLSISSGDEDAEETGEGSSDDMVSVSSGDIGMDPGLMELYDECDELDMISSQQRLEYQERLQEQREQEEQAILGLSAQDFLGSWSQLVTPSMVGTDPQIYQTMRAWLLDVPHTQLQSHSWRANRQLEKLPDVPVEDRDDSDEEEEAAVANGAGAASNVQNELAQIQAKVARLSLLSNYLTFVQRWRQHHGLAPEETTGTGNEAPAASSTADATAEAIAVASVSSPDDDDFEMPFDTPLQGQKGAQDASSIDGHRGIKIEDEEPVLSGADQSSAWQRDLIFEKSRDLAKPEAVEPSVRAAAAAQTDAEAKPVRHIDSGGSDEGEQLDADTEDDAVYAEPVEDAGTAEPMDTSEVDEEEEEVDDGDLDMPNSKRVRLLRDEQDEYACFVGKLRASADDPALEKAAVYGAMRTELEGELQALRANVRDSVRDSSGVDSDMVEDIRMLLTLFGVPYITAPMEAEAQCAVLVSSRLVDGMVTDDSDSFLFASSRQTQVYRHFFQKDRYVEMYSGEAIFQDSSLTQRDMVFLACLLGSDYTVGVKGIGPVLAIEALAEFGPALSDAGRDSHAADEESSVVEALRRFRAWCDSVTEVLPGLDLPDELVTTPLRYRLAQVVRKAGLPASFPDPRVVHAYFHPQVDPSDVAFEWGFPKLDLLRQFMADKLGWSAEKTDETLVPLARKMIEAKDAAADGMTRVQKTLDSYAAYPSDSYNAAGVGHSKRVGAAISHKRRQMNQASAVPGRQHG